MQSTQPAKTSSLGSDFLRFFGAGQQQQPPPPPPPDDPNRITRDGHPAKRRGPKPNSKPAMTRRQELNRQAQRSHRERKEQYIRTMETEVSRLREAYTQEISAANVAVQQHRHMVHSLTEENDILKDILSAHGISYESELESRKSDRPGPGYHQSSPFTSSMGSSTLPTLPPSNGHSLNHNAYTTPPTTVSSNMSPRNGAPSDLSPKSEPSHAGYSHGSHGHAHQCEPMGFMDRSGGMMNGPVPDMGGIFETDPQLQIDFILTLESPCREHTDYLCRRSIVEADDEDMPFSGHALMATCPPPSYLAKTTNENPYPHQTYDLPHANLSTLLNLSRQLVTDQQVTPIMALQCLKQNEMYRTLTRDDVKIIIETLNTKVRCYGFGAVMEEFELSDCLGSVIGAKVDAGAATVHDEFMYA